MKKYLLLFLMAIVMNVHAQVSINTDGSSPDNSAMLDVKSTEKGLLIPRMTQAQRDAIPYPAEALMIYQTDNSPGFYYYAGAPSRSSGWVFVGTGSGWGLMGNDGTDSAVNFIGTSDDQDLIFKRNNERSGYIGLNNTSFGINALNPSNTGIYNTAIGGGSLLFNTTGNNNTANGSGALLFNTNGDNNTANGTNALFKNTTGSSNTANGVSALYNNTGGYQNTANGSEALYFNTTGLYNSATGVNSLFSNTTGNYNTANGTEALFYNTTGEYNTAIGSAALASNEIGSYNTACGYLALNSNTTGFNNTGNGYRALYSNLSGSGNAANGDNALKTNTTGWYNTANGTESLYSNTTGNYNAANGYDALVSNTTGSDNTASGNAALFYNTTGNYNTASGTGALLYNATGEYNTAVGYGSGPTSGALSNTSALGSDAVVTFSNCINIGGSAVTWIGGQVGWSAISDERFKKNVKENVPGLDFILKLKPVTYQWDIKKLDAYRGIPDSLLNNEIMEKARADQEKIVYTGFLAQQVEKAADEAGYDFSGVNKPVNDKTPYSLTYESFTVPLVRSVQEQQAIIEADKIRISALEEKNNTSEAKISILEEKNRQLENRLKLIEEKLKP